MTEEQSINPPLKPYLVIADKTLKCIAIAEDIAHDYKSLQTDLYASDAGAVGLGILNAQNATNQLLVTLFNSINEGFQGLDLLMGDIQKAMNGEPLDGMNFPV